jgi:hypothetical protein
MYYVHAHEIGGGKRDALVKEYIKKNGRNLEKKDSPAMIYRKALDVKIISPCRYLLTELSPS